MYLTSIKEGTVPTAETTTLIDELFGAEPRVNYDYYHTVTQEISRYNGIQMPNYEQKINKHINMLFNFLSNHNVSEMYSEFKIPKHTGGFRTIDAPNNELKTFMREYTKEFMRDFKVLPHDSAYAYIKKRSVIDAVKVHQDNKSRWFLKVDLKDFFGSCNPEFIVEQLSKLYPFAMGDNDKVRFFNLLTELSCLNGKLPQGTPISPWLTNLIMVEFDYKIKSNQNLKNKK